MGKTLRIDTLIQPSPLPDNDGQISLPPIPAGETLQIELFIDGASGNQTTGYTLVFENSNNLFMDFFKIERLEGLIPGTGNPGPISVDVHTQYPVAIPRNNYIGTITLTAKRDIPPNSILAFDPRKTQIVDAQTSRADPLNVSEAVLFFGSREFTIALDLDNSPNNQNIRTGYTTGSETSFDIQVFGNDVQFFTGFILQFEYNPQQLAFTAFEPGDALPEAQTLAPTVRDTFPSSASASLEVTAASFGGFADQNQGLLGTVRFQARTSFSATKILMTGAEIRRGGQFLGLPLPVPISVLLLKPDADFDRDGRVGFRDFLLFAEKFGSQRGDGFFEDRFDMDTDGVVGFADFLIFTEALTAFNG